MKRKALQRILCIIMINNPACIKVEYIISTKHVLTDVIYCIYSQDNAAFSFEKINAGIMR